MSNTSILAKVTNKDQFVTKAAPKWYFQGRLIDLREIDDATAEALANNPRCGFLQWADENKRPDGQKSPLPGKGKAPAAPAKSGGDK